MNDEQFVEAARRLAKDLNQAGVSAFHDSNGRQSDCCLVSFVRKNRKPLTSRQN